MLSRLLHGKRREIADLKTQHDHILKAAEIAPEVRPFARTLSKRVLEQKFGLIAELKPCSPSHGVIRAQFDAASLARSCAEGGRTLPVRADRSGLFRSQT